METQFAIKVILIVVLVAFAAFLMLPGKGARHLALRRLSMLLLLVVLVVAVIFPSLVTQLANFVGVGRGTDLLLYGLIVVFIGNSLVQQRRHRKTELEITRLARLFAIENAPDAATVFAQPAPSPGSGTGEETDRNTPSVR